LKSWQPQVNASEEKDLVSEGEIELEEMGSRVLDRLPELFDFDDENTTNDSLKV
jgi:hypothetical protein